MKTALTTKVIAALIIPMAAQAAGLTWDPGAGLATHPQDGPGTWDTVTAEWWTGTADTTFDLNAPTVFDGATFGALNGVAGTVTLGTSIVCTNVTFNAPGVGYYTIAGGGNTLGITNHAILPNVDGVISASVVGSGLTLSHGAANAPSGVLILSGNNTFTNITLGENGNNQNNVGAPNTTCAVRLLAGGTLGNGNISYNSQGNQSSPRLELAGGATVTNTISAPGRNNPSAAVVAYGSGNVISGTITRGTGGADFAIASESANGLTLSGATGTNNIALASAAGAPRNYVLRGAGSGTVSGNIANNTAAGGNNLGIVKAGSGSWTFSGANTFTNSIAVDAGTLTLDYSTQNNSKITTNGLLTLGGGTVNLNGGSFVQPVGFTAIVPGASAITQSGGSSILQLNTMTRLPGGTVDFGAPSIAETTTPNVNGILGGYATVGGANWAINSTGGANGPIIAYSGYTDIAASGSTIPNNSADNVELSTAGGGGNVTMGSGTTIINTLLQGTTTPATIDTSVGTLYLGPIGGVLIPSGMQSLTIGVSPGSGTLSAGGAVGTPGELVFINNSANNLTVNSVIADNGGSVIVTKAGSGLMTLAGANTYSGATIVSAGTLNVGADSNFGNDPASPTVGNILISGGTLQAVQTFQLNANRNIGLGPTNRYGNGTISVASGQTLTVGGIVANTDTTGSGPGATLTKTGAGILALNGANTYSSGTIITGGSVSITNDNGVGAAPGCYIPDNLVLNGGTLEAAGTLTLNANRGILLGPAGSAGNGTIGVSAGQVLTFAGRVSDNWGGAGSLIKNDSGTLILSGSFSDYSGNTTVNGGVLQLGNARAIPNGTGNDVVTVNNPGLLNVASSVTLDGLSGNGTVDNTNTAPESLAIGYTGDSPNGAFSGVIQNSGGPLTLVVGSGTLTLSGVNTYSGATLIKNGTLALSGSGSIADSTNINIAAGAILNVSGLTSGITLGSAQSLSGAGTLQGNAADNAGSMIVPGGNGTVGTLTVTGNLALGGNGKGTVSFDLSTNTTAGGINNDLVVVDGALTISGTTAINLNYLNGLPSIGAYTLFQYTTFSGNVANLIAPPGFSIINNTSAQAIQLVVTHVPGSLTWKGDGTANVWDTDVTPNWIEGGSNQYFFTGDSVTFDDTGSASPAVNISGTVAPTRITVNATQSYTIVGGGITTGSLAKGGSGSLLLDDTNNTYTGGTLISAGTVQVGNGDTLGTLGSGPVTNNAALIFDRTDTVTASNNISGSGTLTVAGSGNLYLSGSNSYSGLTTIASTGVLHPETATALGAASSPLLNTNGGNLYVDLNINFLNPLTLGGNNVSLEKGGAGVSTLGGSVGLVSSTTLSIDGGATLNLTNAAGLNSSNVPVNLTFAGTGAANISGPLSLNSGSLTVNGGTWTVAPSNSFTGFTTINSGGSLFISGPLSLGPVPASFNASDVTLNGGTLGTSTNVILDDGNVGITVSDVANTSRLTVNGTNATLIVSNNISGDGTAVLTKTGSGRLVLAGANTFSGTLDVDSASTSANDGTTVVANNGALANIVAVQGFPFINIGNNNGGSSTLALDGTSGSITIAPDISLAGRNVPVQSIENIAGNNTISGSFELGVGGTNYTFQSDSGVLNLTALIPYSTPNSARTLTFQGPGSIVDSGGIQNGSLDATSVSNVWVNVVQAGPGLLTMSAANAYSGYTTVSNGVLSLTGSLNSLLGVSVLGGVLVGNGSITGPVAVQPGGTIEAGTTNTIGTLTLGNTLTLSGNTMVKISKTANTADLFSGQTSVTYGGTLTVTNLSGTLALGDHFTLFNPGNSASSFSGIIGSPGAGLAYSFANGVLNVVNGPPTTPTNITFHVSGNVLTLSWPSGYLGWILQAQTNSLHVGISSNWVDVPGSGSVTSTNITINPANPTVFYRLRSP